MSTPPPPPDFFIAYCLVAAKHRKNTSKINIVLLSFVELQALYSIDVKIEAEHAEQPLVLLLY